MMFFGWESNLAESNGSLQPGLWLKSPPACWLPTDEDQLRAQCSLIDCRSCLLLYRQWKYIALKSFIIHVEYYAAICNACPNMWVIIIAHHFLWTAEFWTEVQNFLLIIAVVLTINSWVCWTDSCRVFFDLSARLCYNNELVGQGLGFKTVI